MEALLIFGLSKKSLIGISLAFARLPKRRRRGTRCFIAFAIECDPAGAADVQKRSLLPAAVPASNISKNEARHHVRSQHPEAERHGGEMRPRHVLDDVVDARVLHALEEARPAPVSGYERAGYPSYKARKREHRPRKRKLKTDQVDRYERRLFGRPGQAGYAEADGGHGRVDERQQAELADKVPGEMADDIHEHRHPQRLRGDERGEEGGLAHDVTDGPH